MRVFIGLTEIANCVRNYSAGLAEIGVSTFTVLHERALAYTDSEYDLVLSEDIGQPPSAHGVTAALKRLMWRVRYYAIVLRAVLTCDVFVFIFGHSFRVDRWDYRILKALGKRIVSVFLGDDTRYWYAYTREAELLGTDADIRPYLDEVLRDRAHDYFAVKLEVVRKAEAYADLILALPDAAQLHSRPYMRLNIPIDLSRIDCQIMDREVPLIVHAPSVRDIKGTRYVLAAIECLRSEGLAFEFRLIERMPNVQLRALLAHADVVIDQMYSETVATVALEGLASGNVVLTRYLPERVLIGADCPVVNVNVDTLVDRLREVVVDRELRKRLAQAGRPYVEKYHSHVVVARQIVEWLDPTRRGEFQFFPDFFAKHFCVPPELLKRESEMLAAEPPHMRIAGDIELTGVRMCAEQVASPQSKETSTTLRQVS